MEQLKSKVKKNRDMVRRAAPITIESTRFLKLSQRIEAICHKMKERNKL